MDINRKTAFEALLDIEVNGAYSNLAAASAIGQYYPDNEPFVRTLIYGVLENQIYLDYRLGGLVRSGMQKVRTQARILLRMGAYQIEFMNSVPDYAAINETVKMTRKLCRGLEGFVNGVLRAYARGGGAKLPDPSEDAGRFLSLRYSYSEDITEMWLARFGQERTCSLMEAGNAVPDLTIRVNTLKCSPQQLAERLADSTVSLEPVQVPEPYGIPLQGTVFRAGGTGILGTDAFREGWFYVQDAASSAAVAALDPRPGDTLLDVCAAPGGKSFASAMLMEGKGKIFSCDIYEHKMELIRSTAEKLGIDIIEPVHRDARQPNPDFAELADCVIADVPCSGLGVVRRRPEMKRKTNRADMEKLPALQKDILEAAAVCVRPGGRLMYSTCTISEMENEQITKAFLKQHDEFRVLHEKQFFPDTDFCDGFYFCIMQKDPA